MDTRQALRKKLKVRRNNLSADEQRLASHAVKNRLLNHPSFQKSQHIAAYLSINNEIDPRRLIEEIWQHGKYCYLPVVIEKKLIFIRYKPTTALKKNHLGVLEPDLSPTTTIQTNELDLVLVPLLGFTQQGQRLGMGGGAYDRSFSFLLTKNRPPTPQLIGLAYEWQKLTGFEKKPWDTPLDAIITEQHTYCIDHRSRLTKNSLPQGEKPRLSS